MTRLESLSPDLADKLRRASETKQRAAAVAACEFAIIHAKVAHELVEKVLEKVRAAGVLNANDKTELEALAAQLDEKYFAMHEAAEEGRANTEDGARLFGQARAVTALSFAGGEDALQAAMEAIYEATVATDDKEELIAVVRSALQDRRNRGHERYGTRTPAVDLRAPRGVRQRQRVDRRRPEYARRRLHAH